MTPSQAKRIAVDLFGPTARVTTRGGYTTVYTLCNNTKTIYGEGEGVVEALLDCFEDPVHTCMTREEAEKFSGLVESKLDSQKNV